MDITFKQLKNLSWLRIDTSTLRILVLPSTHHLKEYVRPHNPKANNMDRSELFKYAEEYMQDIIIVDRYDGINVVDVTHESSLEYLDWFVYQYYPKDNVIIITDSLLH